MITIYLIWTLMSGVVYDVDSFHKLEHCQEALSLWSANLKAAQAQKPELNVMAIVGCHEVPIAPPAMPEPKKESL